MSNNLKSFISCLKQIQEEKKLTFEVIKYPRMLFDSLSELDAMVGMSEVKEDIIRLIRMLMIKKMRKTNGINNINTNTTNKDRLLHTMLLGNPGTGKTAVGLILCKIYTSLNLLTIPEVMPPTGEEKCDIFQLNKRPCPDSTANENLVTKKLKEDLAITSGRLVQLNDKIRRQSYYTDLLIADLNRYKRGYFNRALRFDYVDYFINGLISIKRGADDMLHPPTIILPPSPPPPIVEPEPIFKVCSRADLVGQWVGHTAPKTRKFLNSAMGGVCFIDEAYSLLLRDDDPFGLECLAVIIDYMTRFNANIVIILAGYEKAMKASILNGQEGLKSRIGHTCNIKPYNISELVDIFILQLTRNDWEITCSKERLIEIFTQNKECITNGRDTQNLVSKCVDAHATISFSLMLENQPIIFKINEEMLLLGLKEMNALHTALVGDNAPPFGMYT
jgi:hypothetical protein